MWQKIKYLISVFLFLSYLLFIFLGDSVGVITFFKGQISSHVRRPHVFLVYYFLYFFLPNISTFFFFFLINCLITESEQNTPKNKTKQNIKRWLNYPIYPKLSVIGTQVPSILRKDILNTYLLLIVPGLKELVPPHQQSWKFHQSWGVLSRITTWRN